MKKAIILSLAFTLSLVSAEAKTHLFILSGQSNMARLNPDRTYTKAVKQALAPDEVVVVKEAWGGRPIMGWYKGWKPGKSGEYPIEEEKLGSYYDQLMASVKPAMEGKEFDTVTFVWMQGERDARTDNDDVYEESFKGLIKQLEADLGRDDINVVIGRLGDDYLTRGNKEKPGWVHLREIQVALAEGNPHWEWVDTDDLPMEEDKVHYLRNEGYDELGNRFAEKSVALVKARSE